MCRKYGVICGKYVENWNYVETCGNMQEIWRDIENMKKYVALGPRGAEHRAKRVASRLVQPSPYYECPGTWKNSELSTHIGYAPLYNLRDLEKFRSSIIRISSLSACLSLKWIYFYGPQSTFWGWCVILICAICVSVCYYFSSSCFSSFMVISTSFLLTILPI